MLHQVLLYVIFQARLVISKYDQINLPKSCLRRTYIIY